MTYGKQLVSAAILLALTASVVNAQVLPRNKARANANQGTNAAANAERAADNVNRAVEDAQGDAPVRVQAQGRTEAGAAANQNQRSQVRVQNRADADVQRTTTATAEGVSVIRSTQLVGTVVNVQDQRMGQITEVVFNNDGCIQYLVVDIDGKMAPIPWRVGNYDVTRRAFVLEDFDQARIERIPTFTDFEQISDRTFVNEVDTFYGIDADAGAATRGNSVIRSETNRSSTGARTTNQKETSTQRNRSTNQDANRSSTSDSDEPSATKSRSSTEAKSNVDRPSTGTQKSGSGTQKSGSGTQKSSTGAQKSGDAQKSDSQDDSQSNESSSENRSESSQPNPSGNNSPVDAPATESPNSEKSDSDQ